MSVFVILPFLSHVWCACNSLATVSSSKAVHGDHLAITCTLCVCGICWVQGPACLMSTVHCRYTIHVKNNHQSHTDMSVRRIVCTVSKGRSCTLPFASSLCCLWDYRVRCGEEWSALKGVVSCDQTPFPQYEMGLAMQSYAKCTSVCGACVS